MNRYLLTVMIGLVVLLGATAAVTAQSSDGATAQGDGPPVDLPDPVPEFVTDLLGTISEFISGVLTALGEVLQGLTPGAGSVPPAGV